MASPPVEQRGTGDRGITASRTNKVTDSKVNKRRPKAPNPTPAPIGSCSEYLTINPELSDTSTGTGIHRIIREQVGPYITRQGYGLPLKIRLPDGSFEHYRDGKFLNIGNKGSGNGDVDLAFRSRSGSVMLLAEIKPANWEALVGETQLANYIDKANNNEDILRKWEVLVFSPMRADSVKLPRIVIYQSRRFQVKWCGPGIIVYKEIGKKKKKKRDPKENQDVKEQSKEEANDKYKKLDLTNPLSFVEPLTSKPRKIEFEPWVPEALRQEILANKTPDGLYRGQYQAAWPSGHTANVVVWVKRGPLGREYQYYLEFPIDQGFYDYFAKKKGLSDWQRNLVRATLVEYNKDLFSLLSPNSVTGEPSSRSPEYARIELRTIYAEILKGVAKGSAQIVLGGAGITALGNSMKQRATLGRGVEHTGTGKNADKIGTAEEPLPDWINKAFEQGFKQARQSKPTVVP